jgi:cytochrome c peroxidase
MKRLMLMMLIASIISSCDRDLGANEPSTNPIDAVTPNTETSILDYSDILNLPVFPLNYANINLPNYFNQDANIDNTPNDNQVSDWGATLGRVLFYDKKLSQNETVACASCHQAAHGFSDNSAFSTGFNGGLTGRNSMGLANAKFYNNGHFFWDERANTLEDQVLGPIQNPVEMGMTLAEVVERVGAEDYYKVLFEAAFGDEVVNSDRISLALSQFIRSILSFNSKYDAGRSQVNNPRDNFPNFTAEENQGKALFFGRGNCAACHGTESFVGPTARNNGLDLVYADNGVGEISGNPNDNGDFKVPSLRNIELTTPYMHDGRFATLEAVINHYSNGVQNHPNLSNQLRGQNGQPRQGNFNNTERAALVAFFKTLTDTQFINDERYNNPFIE